MPMCEQYILQPTKSSPRTRNLRLQRQTTEIGIVDPQTEPVLVYYISISVVRPSQCSSAYLHLNMHISVIVNVKSIAESIAWVVDQTFGRIA